MALVNLHSGNSSLRLVSLSEKQRSEEQAQRDRLRSYGAASGRLQEQAAATAQGIQQQAQQDRLAAYGAATGRVSQAPATAPTSGFTAYTAWADRANALSQRISDTYAKGWQSPEDYQSSWQDILSESRSLMDEEQTYRDYWKRDLLFDQDTVDTVVSGMDSTHRWLSSLSGNVSELGKYYAQFGSAKEMEDYEYKQSDEYLSDATGERLRNQLDAANQAMSVTGGREGPTKAYEAAKARLDEWEQRRYAHEAQTALNDLSEDELALLDKRNGYTGPQTALGNNVLRFATSGVSNFADAALRLASGMGRYEAPEIDEKAVAEGLGKRYTQQEIRQLQEYRAAQRNAEQSASDAAFWSQAAARTPILSSALSVGLSPYKALGLVESVRSVLPSWAGGYVSANRPTDVNSPWFSANRTQRTIRGTVDQNIDSPLGSFLYNAGMSAMDSAVNMAIGAGVASGFGLTGAAAEKAAATTVSWLMGSQVAADTVMEEIQKGRSNEGALALGIVRGVIEHLSEKYSVEQILKQPKSVLSGLGKSFAAEGAEEVASNWANRLVNLIINDQSEINERVARLKANGVEDDSYALMLAVLEEDVGAFVAGGLSGLAMSGVSMGGRALTHADDADVGKVLRANGSQAELVTTALGMDPNTRTYKLAQALQAQENVSDKQLGELYRLMESEVDADTGRRIRSADQAESVIQAALTLPAESEAHKLAEKVTRTGSRVTDKQVGQLYKAVTDEVDKANIRAYNEAVEGVRRVAEAKPAEQSLDSLVNAYRGLGMKEKAASQKAALVQKVRQGVELTPAEVRALNFTNLEMQRVFTEATGVKIPEGVGRILSQPDGAAQLAADILEQSKAIAAGAQAKAESEVRAKNAAAVDEILAPYRGAREMLNAVDGAVRQMQVAEEATAAEAAAQEQATAAEAQDAVVQKLSEITVTDAETGQPMSFAEFVEKARAQQGGETATDEELQGVFALIAMKQGVIDEATFNNLKEEIINANRTGAAADGRGLSGNAGERSEERAEAVSGRAGGTEAEGGGRGAAAHARGEGGVGSSGLRNLAEVQTPSEREEVNLDQTPVEIVTDSAGRSVMSQLPDSEFQKTTTARTLGPKYKALGLNFGGMVGPKLVYDNDGQVVVRANGETTLGQSTVVRLDDARYTGVQLGGHELGHQIIFLQPEAFDNAMTALVEVLTEQDLRELRLAYADAFHDAYAKTADGRARTQEELDRLYLEEIICDAYGQMDRAGTNASAYHDAVATVLDQAYEELTGILLQQTPDGRFSIDSITEAGGLTFEKDGQVTVLKDNKGNAVTNVTQEMLKKSPLGAVIQANVDSGFLTEEQGKDMRTLFAGLYNLLLKTQDIDLIWAVNSTIGFQPIEGRDLAAARLTGRKSRFAAFTKNSDPQYSTTVDFTTICLKTQAVIDAMSATMKKLGHGLTEDEIIDIVYRNVYEAGEPVPCPVCYVFSRWVGLGGLFDKMLRLQAQYENVSAEQIRADIAALEQRVVQYARDNGLSEYNKKGGISSEARNALYKELYKEYDDLAYKAYTDRVRGADTLSAVERKRMDELEPVLRNLDNWTWLTDVRLSENYAPVPTDVLLDINAGKTFAEQYPESWRYRTTRGPAMGKAATPYADEHLGQILRGAGLSDLSDLGDSAKNPFLDASAQKGELSKDGMATLLKSRAAVKKQNLLNGQRFQSTSDFRFEYALDYLMAFTEMQLLGSKVQLYTKVPEAVHFFASVQAEVNCSLMPYGSGVFTDANGNKSLVFSDVTGMSADDAFRLQNTYDNVQTILVGISDEHIRLAMADPRILFIIPYHASGASEGRYVALMDIVGESVPDRDDYSNYQTDHEDKNANDRQKAARDIRVKLLTGNLRVPTTAEAEIVRTHPILSELYKRFYGTDVDGNASPIDQRYLPADLRGQGDVYRDPECFNVFLTSDQAKTIMPFEYWDRTTTTRTADENGRTFAAYAESLGLHPRFSGWDAKGNYDASKDFSQEPGYWKTLGDRRLYNRDGSYHEQQAIDVTNFDARYLFRDEAVQGITKPSQVNNPEATEAIAEKSAREVSERRAQAQADLEAREAELGSRKKSYKKDLKSLYKSLEGQRYSLEQNDTDYLAAVERGDTEEAQRMVDEAAASAGAITLPGGRRKPYFHGTAEKFTIFDINKARYGTYGYGFYFSPMKSKAEGYGDVNAYYLMSDKIATHDDHRITPEQVQDARKEFGLTVREDAQDQLTKWVANSNDLNIILSLESAVERNTNISPAEMLAKFRDIFGYDGVRHTNETILWDNRLIKSADPVTYDNAGNVIPLSERFNPVNEDIRYSLMAFDDDGTRFVDVQTDQKQFDGLSDTEKMNLAKRIIKKKFLGKVIGLDNKAFVNGNTAEEYSRPVKFIDSDVVDAKMRASTELDNLIDAGTNFRNEPDGKDGHVHPDVIGGFDYFDTIFRVGDEYFRGTVNIKNIKNGKLLKDVTKIENITKDITASYGKNPKCSFLRDVSMDTIPQAGEKGKTVFSSAPNIEQRVANYTPIDARRDLAVMKKSPDTFADSSTGELVKYSLAEDQDAFEPLRDENGNIKYVYKAFYAMKDADGKGHLYPPMVSNLTDEERKSVRGAVSGTQRSLDTPVGVVLDADVGMLGRYKSDTVDKYGVSHKKGDLIRNTRGRLAVQNDKGGGTLAFRPGWHAGEWPDAKQFNKDSALGPRSVMPDGLVFARCEISGAVDYQLEAMEYGVGPNGKFNRSQAGLPRVPVNGYYKYRTNVDPTTAPWYISGQIRVVEILTDEQCREICAQYGVEPSPRESGHDIDLAAYGLQPGPVTPETDLDRYRKSQQSIRNEQELEAALNDPTYADAYVPGTIDFDDPEIRKEFERNKQDAEMYRSRYQDRSARYSVAEPDSYAPTFYSKLEQEVDAFKGDKIGAASFVNYLRGHGVKAEEIKWSGIQTFLEGKKSVTKQELLDWLRANRLEIQTEVLDGGDGTIQYTPEEHAQFDEISERRGEYFQEAEELWRQIFNESMPLSIYAEEASGRALRRAFSARRQGSAAFNATEKHLFNDISKAIDAAETEMQAIVDAAKARAENAQRIVELEGTDLTIQDYMDRARGFAVEQGLEIEFEDQGDQLVEFRTDPETGEVRETSYIPIKERGQRTHWSDYKLDDGRNYREYLFRMPGSDYSNTAMEAHWERPGVLAHARVQDFSSDGKPVLFVDEIQSDWHNAGQKTGYQTGEAEDDGLIEDSWLRPRKPPEAPYSKNYHEFVLKNLLRNAAENGFDYLAWTTGKMQEERWSDRYAEGYRIEYDQDIPKFLNKYGKQWGAQVTEIPLDETDVFDPDNRLRVPAIPITPEMKQRVLYEGQPRYSISDDLQKWIDLQTQYGVQPESAGSVRPTEVPKRTAPGNKVSHSVPTIMGANPIPEFRQNDMKSAVVGGEFSFTPSSNKVELNKAEAWVKRYGWHDACRDWLKDTERGKTGAYMVARGAVLLNNAANSNAPATEFVELASAYAKLLRASAQSVQAAKILQKLTPEARLYGIQKTVDKLNEELLRKMGIDPNSREYERAKIRIDAALIDAFLRAASEEERDQLMDRMAENVAGQIKSTGQDLFTALRYLNMLGNFRTQIRNLVGNFGFQPVRIAKDILVGAAETALNKAGVKVDRTSSAAVDTATWKAAGKVFQEYRNVVLAGGKYQDDVGTDFAGRVNDERRKHIFTQTQWQGFNKTVGKALDKYQWATDWAMDQGDAVFCEFTFRDSLARFMAANHTTWDKASDALRTRAVNKAIRDAAEATYRDNNWLSEWFSHAGRGAGTNSKIAKLAEGIAPFRKTPANILMRAYEYSPLSIIGNTITDIQAARGKKGKAKFSRTDVTANDIIEQWAKTFTGTGLAALGYALAAMGKLIGKAPDDDKEKALFEQQGKQAYSLTLGNHTFTLDWLAPEAIPLFFGANIEQAAVENGLSLREGLEAIMRIGDPILEMSMLQGINDAIDNAATFGNDSALFNLVLNAAWGYVTQGITNTFLGQLERGLQGNQRMQTYVDKNADLPDAVQKALGKTSAKVPGWDYNQIPYIDAWGDPQENADSETWNVITQLFSPAYVTRERQSATLDEISRLYDETGDSSIILDRAPKYFRMDNATINLTADEYVTYAMTRGETAKAIVADLVESPKYQALPDSQRNEVIKITYDYANQMGKAAVSSFTPEKWVRSGEEAIQQGMSLSDYMLFRASLREHNEGSSSISNAEREAAIRAIPGLSKAERDYLWESAGGNPNSTPTW